MPTVRTHTRTTQVVELTSEELEAIIKQHLADQLGGAWNRQRSVDVAFDVSGEGLRGARAVVVEDREG